MSAVSGLWSVAQASRKAFGRLTTNDGRLTADRQQNQSGSDLEKPPPLQQFNASTGSLFRRVGLLLLGLFDDFVLHLTRHLGVVAEVLAVHAPTAGQ